MSGVFCSGNGRKESGIFVKDSFNVAGSGQSIKGMRRVGGEEA